MGARARVGSQKLSGPGSVRRAGYDSRDLTIQYLRLPGVQIQLCGTRHDGQRLQAEVSKSRYCMMQPVKAQTTTVQRFARAVEETVAERLVAKASNWRSGPKQKAQRAGQCDAVGEL